jgi:hypothetical protein
MSVSVVLSDPIAQAEWAEWQSNTADLIASYRAAWGTDRDYSPKTGHHHLADVASLLAVAPIDHPPTTATAPAPVYGPDYRPATRGPVFVTCPEPSADPAAAWAGADHHSPTCGASVTRRGATDPTACGRPMFPTIGGRGWSCPKHGADAPRVAPSGDETVTHSLTGTRSGMRRTDRTDHHAWCNAPTTIGAGRSRRTAPCGRTGTADGWSCPDHGAEAVVGCSIPRPVDDGGPAAVWGTDAAGHSRYVDASKGERVPDMSRASYAARSSRRRGNAVTPEPSAPVMASGAWSAIGNGARPDGGAVVVERLHISGAYAWHPRYIVIAPARDGRGTLARLTADHRAALLAHRPDAADAVTRQMGATAAKRTASATTASKAAASKRTATAKRATATARAERAAHLESLAALAASIKSPAALAYVASERKRKAPASR